MKKEIISTKQGVSIMFLFLIGTTLVTGSANKAKQDAWISILIAIITILPVMFVYSRILQLFPGKNLFDIAQEVFGKVVGKFLILIFTWYFFHLGALVIRNITEFIQIVSFSETPQFFIALFLGLVTIYMVKNGIEVLGRWAEFVLPVVIFSITLVTCLSAPQMNPNYIKPVLYNGFKPAFQGAFSLISYPFAETVIFTVIFSSLEEKNKTFQVYYLGLIIGGLIILMAALRNLLVLGASAISIHYFTSYYAASLINIGNFIQRIEVIVSIVMILCCVVKLSVCLFATSIGVSKFFNFDDYRTLAAPICLLMMNLSFIVYNNTMEMFEWIDKTVAYYAIPIQVALPLIIWVAAEFKKSSFFKAKDKKC